MKKIFIVIIVAAVLIFSFLLFKNVAAKAAVSTGVRAVTGLKLSMNSFNIGIFKSVVHIDGLKLFNTKEFEDKLMMNMPEIYVDYDLGALLKKKVHLEEVRLDLEEFIVVKNKEGKVNLDSLKVVKREKKETKKPSGKKSELPEVKIDTLQLKIGKVVYKDYYNRSAPAVREFKINLNERYKNIDDPEKLANLIVLKALINTPVATLTDFDLGLLDEGLEATLGTASKVVGGAAGVALETADKVTDTAKEATEKVGETIKNILPFGKE